MKNTDLNKELISSLDEINNKLEQLRRNLDVLSLSHNYLKTHWIDNVEVCDTLNITKRTLANYVRAGKIKKSSLGGKWYFKSDDIVGMLEEGYGGNDEC
jgi:hypothetical protein